MSSLFTEVDTSPAAEQSRQGRSATVPSFAWLREYRSGWLRNDAVAGVTLAAYAIPVSLAYATLAGLPPQAGIYCYLVGGMAYAVCGSSRQLAIGPTSAISMLVGVTVAGMVVDAPGRVAAVAALAALVVGVLCFIAWSLRLSALVSFISETILLGFKAGAALTIALTQLPKFFGVPGGGDHFFERLWILLQQLLRCNLVVVSLGSVALLILLLGEKKLPGRPVALAVLIGATLITGFASLGDYGVATVGALPQGLPELRIPSLRLRDVDGIVPLGMACLLLAYLEGVSAARTLASRHRYEISPRQELLALGVANLAVAFSQGFPVAGGLSQSAVNDKAGAQTPLALLFASLTLAICLLFFTGLVEHLPSVVLAAVVLVAVKGLIDLRGLRELQRISRTEFRVALVAFAGVLLLGILKGVLVAAIVSLLLLLAGAAQPHVAFLGRIPGTKRFSDLQRHPENEIITGALIFRPESSLLYFNVDHVRRAVWDKLRTSPPLQLVVCDLSNAPFVDVAGARMLIRLNEELQERQAHLRIVEPHARVRDLLRASGLETQVGYFGRRMTLDDILSEFPQGDPSMNVTDSSSPTGAGHHD